MSEYRRYPVRVEGPLDAPLSRGLWLVKWLLLIPHYVVLAFLWLGFVVLTVAAFFSILITGRYPRPLFDFNVGVLRWSWRVHYYGYAALGTDRYPPFTLADVPDYPARLSVEYPERLSRGLVLVKTWLLALPHYLVVALFAGGGVGTVATAEGGVDFAATGLIGLLVIVAGVVLLFTKSYPRPLHDFIIGMDRWVLRVVAYAALMTDEYPPFRLDEGGVEPGSPEHQGPRRATGWTTGRVVSAVVGAVMALTATGLLTGAAGTLWLDRTQRAADGFLTSPETALVSGGHAVVAEHLTVHEGLDRLNMSTVVGELRLMVTARDSSRPVFVGVGRSTDVARYLDGVALGVVDDSGRAVDRSGGAPAGPPGDQAIWAASTEKSGTAVLSWEPGDGDWTAVAMYADAGRGVDVRVSAGATLPALPWLSLGLFTAGALLLACAALLIGMAAHRASRTPPSPGTGVTPPLPAPVA